MGGAVVCVVTMSLPKSRQKLPSQRNNGSLEQLVPHAGGHGRVTGLRRVINSCLCACRPETRQGGDALTHVKALGLL